MDAQITIEQLEALATRLETDDAAKREKLMRMIRAYCRILAQREPKLWGRMPTEHADCDGHWDNSYPPAQKYKNHSGPRLIEVVDHRTNDIATSGGFYYDWKRVTEQPGLYVSRDGRIFGCQETGTGRVGRFAAHPGDCDVSCTLEWSPRDVDEITTVEIETVEAHLRGIAFPASAP